VRVLWQKVGKTPAAGGSKQVARAGAFAKSRENARRRRKSNRSPERAFLRKAGKTPAAGENQTGRRSGRFCGKPGKRPPQEEVSRSPGRALLRKARKTPAAGESKQVAGAGVFAESRENARRRRKQTGRRSGRFCGKPGKRPPQEEVSRSPERVFWRKARKTPAAGGSKQVARAGVLAESQENARCRRKQAGRPGGSFGGKPGKRPPQAEASRSPERVFWRKARKTPADGTIFTPNRMSG